MDIDNLQEIWAQIRLVLKSHPWHGVPIGNNVPSVVNTYVEIVPTDTVKYEIEKNSGYLKVDRPQKYSNICPTPYGFVPQTLCGTKTAEFCMEKTGRSGIKGDGDPLDICVLTEKEITHSDIFLKAVPIGGLRMIDGNEADDKIIAVMEGDGIFGHWIDITDAPITLTERLKHYFLTYKDAPGAEHRNCEITHVYGRDEAHEVINRSYEDYLAKYGDLDRLLKMDHDRLRDK
ncbi:MAG: inorganic pyrophosphatase [Ignavibacteria bacterium]|nr:inorganic pyrophosphatase [Ignavibacteria bacterium]